MRRVGFAIVSLCMLAAYLFGRQQQRQNGRQGKSPTLCVCLLLCARPDTPKPETADDNVQESSRMICLPLTPPEFKERMAARFPDIFLASASVVEGVVLVLLAEKTFTTLTEKDMAFNQWRLLLPYALACMITIISISFHMNLYLAIFRRTLVVMDNVAPFLMGAAQVAQIFYMEERAWWLFNGGIALGAALALIANRKQTTPELFALEYQAGYKIINNAQVENIFLFTFAGICSLVAFVLLPEGHEALNASSGVARVSAAGALMYFVFMIGMLLKARQEWIQMNRLFGVVYR